MSNFDEPDRLYSNPNTKIMKNQSVSLPANDWLLLRNHAIKKKIHVTAMIRNELESLLGQLRKERDDNEVPETCK